MAANVYECEICFEDYDSEDHKPLFLTCGHTFGLSCARQLVSSGEIICPRCRKILSTPVDDLPTNYSLIPGENRIIQDTPSSSSLDLCLNHGYALDHFCVGCESTVCRKCIKRHHSNHRVVFMDDLLRMDPDEADFITAMKRKIETDVNRLTISMSVPMKISSLLEEINKCHEDMNLWKELLLEQKTTASHDLASWNSYQQRSGDERNELFKKLCGHWKENVQLLPDSKVLSNFRTKLDELTESLTLIEEVVQNESIAMLDMKELVKTTASSSNTAGTMPNTTRTPLSSVEAVPNAKRSSKSCVVVSPSYTEAVPKTKRPSQSCVVVSPSNTGAVPNTKRPSQSCVVVSPSNTGAVPNTKRPSQSCVVVSPSNTGAVPNTKRPSQSCVVVSPGNTEAETKVFKTSSFKSDLLPGDKDWAVCSEAGTERALDSIRAGCRPKKVVVVSWAKEPLWRLGELLAVLGDACSGDMRVALMDVFWSPFARPDERLQSFIETYGYKVKQFYGSPSDVVAVSQVSKQPKLHLGIRLGGMSDIELCASLATKPRCVSCIRGLPRTAGGRMHHLKWTPEFWHFPDLQDGDEDWVNALVKPFMSPSSWLLDERLFRYFLPRCKMSESGIRRLLKSHPKFLYAIHCETTYLTSKQQSDLTSIARKKNISLHWAIPLEAIL